MENKKVKGSFNDCCHIMLSLELLENSDSRRLNVENKKVKDSFNDCCHIMLSFELLDNF